MGPDRWGIVEARRAVLTEDLQRKKKPPGLQKNIQYWQLGWVEHTDPEHKQAMTEWIASSLRNVDVCNRLRYMFYQSAADSELLRVAGPGDVALSKDKQADKNSHSHSLSVSEAPWRRGKEERMINRRSCRASPHLPRSCSNVKHCSMLEWDIDSCPNRSTDSKNTSCARSPWKALAVLLYFTVCCNTITKDCTLTVHQKKVCPLSSRPPKGKNWNNYSERFILTCWKCTFPTTGNSCSL